MDTLVDIWDSERWYSSGPNETRLPNKWELNANDGNGLDGWICCEVAGVMVVIQSNMPYKDVFYWHERGHLSYKELHDFQDSNGLQKEFFCDNFMFFICGWKRSMEAMLWLLSAWNGQNYLLERILAQVGEHVEEFREMLEKLIEQVDKRVSKQKRTRKNNGTPIQASENDDNIDLRWWNNLKTLKNAFDRPQMERKKVNDKFSKSLENDTLTGSEAMNQSNTIVDVYDPGRCYKAGPSYSRKPSSKEIEENGGSHAGNWICFEKYGVIIMQQDIPYRQMLFWRARGYGIWNELHGTDSEPSFKRERFCDDIMFFFCGWKRSMETMLWLLSIWSGPMILYSMNKRVLAQVGEHVEEFQKMLDGLMERVEKRVSKHKKSRKANDVLTSKNDDGSMDAERNVDIHWLENLKKLKQEFNSGK